MATESKIKSRMRKLPQRRGLGLRRPTHNQSVGHSEKQTAAPYAYSAPFQLPEAYANTPTVFTTQSDEMQSQQPSPVSSIFQEKGSDERRCSKRKPVNLTGVIKNEGSSLDVDVLVKDMSINGVCLAVDRDNPCRQLPSRNPFIAEVFQIYIPIDKMNVRCKLVWRNGDLFGAVFDSTPQFQR